MVVFLGWIAGSYCRETPLLMGPHASKGKIAEGLSFLVCVLQALF